MNNLIKSSFVVNLLRPATYISFSFASASVRSFLRSGLEIKTLNGRPGSSSRPCRSKAFWAEDCEMRLTWHQHYHTNSNTYRRCVLYITKPSRIFELFTRPPDIENQSILDTVVSILHHHFQGAEPHLAEKFPHGCIICWFWEVRNIERGLPC